MTALLLEIFLLFIASAVFAISYAALTVRWLNQEHDDDYK